MDSLSYSLHATIPIFAVIFISWVLQRRGFFPDGFIAGADRFTFRVLLPVMLFLDISGGRITESFDPGFFLFCAAVTVVMFTGVWIGASLLLRDKTMVGAFVQGSCRSTVAILGVAFAQNLYGSAGLVPLMIVAIVPLYNVFAVVVLTVTAAGPLPGRSLARSCVRGIVTNPIILGIVAGLPFALMGTVFPPMLDKTLHYFSAMATPLALVVIGAGFEGRKALCKLRPALAASVIKLVGLPLIFLPVGYYLGFRDEALVALLIMLGSPTTVTSYIMAKNMGGDASLSSSIIVLTTAASAVTLTIFLYILRSTGAI